MSKSLLTVITSSYNRCELLKRNLTRMLKYDISGVFYLVCDNASTDNTWLMLQTLTDSKLRVMHNDNNWDIFNASLLVEYVDSEYFLFLNDRDYIEEDALQNILCFLEDHNDCDLITSLRAERIFKEGYYEGVEFYDFFYLANHPGNAIYKTEFYKKYVDFSELRKLIINQRYEEINNYISCQILLNIGKCYHRTEEYIIQPKDRDKTLKQVRKELFGYAYILPEWHIKLFNSLIEYVERYRSNLKVKNLLISTYKMSLRKVELEFWLSVASEDFCIRNHCKGAKRNDWFKNGKRYTDAVLGSSKIGKYIIKRDINRIFFRDSALNLGRIIKAKICKL